MVRLPGFVRDEPTGLGTVIARATSGARRRASEPALVSACTAPGLAAVTPDQVLRFTMDEFLAALPTS